MVDVKFKGIEEIDIPQLKNSIEGVFREPIEVPKVQEVLHRSCSHYAIVCEGMGTEDEHYHFLAQSDKRITKHGLRKLIKDIHPHLVQDDYKNGVLNISNCVNVQHFMVYITKEVIPQISHGYFVGMWEKLQKYSYQKKKKSMTQEIAELKDRLLHHELDVQEYVVQYRLLRLKHKNPDPHWQKEAYRAFGMRADEKQIREEVEKFFSWNINIQDA